MLRTISSTIANKSISINKSSTIKRVDKSGNN